MPRHSVVIPAYNAERTVVATIRSVLAQGVRDFELIVVDDESSDRTPELVEELGDPRITLVRQANAGTAGARNTGIGRASGEYVSFLDNDDLWMPGYLGEMRAALDAHPEAGFAYCDGWALDDATSRVHRSTELESRPPPPPGADQVSVFVALVRSNFVLSSATVRRDALEAVGGFDTEIRGTDDFDLWLRLMATGRSAVRAGTRPLMLQRGRADSQSKDELMMVRNTRVTMCRLADDPGLPESVREAVLRRIRDLDRELEMMAGSSFLPRAAFRLRAAAVSLRHSLLRDRYWPAELPPDVVAAFPELAAAARASS